MNQPVWQILSLKYDMRHHATWPAILLDDDGSKILLCTISGSTLVHYTRGIQIPMIYRSDMTFWRDRWYNVFANFGDNNELREFYCNVAMPLSITDSTISWVDL